MCPPDIAQEAHDPMRDSSRMRSDSLEASNLQQDRKRPRLAPDGKTQLEAEENLPKSGLTESPLSEHPPDDSDVLMSSGGTCPPKLSNDSSSGGPEMDAGSNLPQSKVTINTRPATNDGAENTMETPIQSPQALETSPPQQVSTESSHSPRNTPDMIAHHPETVSIHSSPSPSPEIQIAIVEDIDQDPAETSWVPVTRLKDNSLQEQADIYYVSRTFPFAQRSASSPLHDILPEIGRVFLQEDQDGKVLLQVKEWLVTFVEVHPHISQRLVLEERAFWEELPDTVNCLLRRLIEVPAEVAIADFEQFLVAYCQLVFRFIDLDLRTLNRYKTRDTLDEPLELYSRVYLPTLAVLLQYREVPLYTILHASRGASIPRLIATLCESLIAGPHSIWPTLTSFLDTLGYFLPKQAALAPAFVETLAVANALTQASNENAISATCGRLASGPTIEKANQQLLRLWMKADELLQRAISKQSSWLTIDNSPNILRFLSAMLMSISSRDRQVATQLMVHVPDVSYEISPAELPEIIAYSWKFKTLHRYITTGRMELRVYGMDSIRMDLIHVWKCYVQYDPQSPSVPLVGFLVEFLRQCKMVQYIVGVDSHPQLVGRGGNVVGFLVVAGHYRDDDSDVIWRTVQESQDPRMVSEVLNLLKTIFGMQSLPNLLHLCQKLLELPVERYDARLMDYTEALLHFIREKTAPLTHREEYLDAVPFKVCVRLIRDVIASQTCSSEQKYHLPTWAADNLARLLTFNIGPDDKRILWKQCVQDIAEKTPFATGSMRALQAWLDVRPEIEVPILTRDFDFTRLLIEELIECLAQLGQETHLSTNVQILLPSRLLLLALVAQHAPDTVTEELTERLWSGVFDADEVNVSLRNMAWEVMSKVVTRCPTRNSLVDRLTTKFLPLLEADKLNGMVLRFAQNATLYEARIDRGHETEDDASVSLPGIERVWRFVMECPPGTVEEEATNWIIKQYLDHDFVLRRPRRVVEATHLALVDGCLSKVFFSASRLRSLSDEAASRGDEPTVVIADEGHAEAKSEKRRLTRSLLFLRGFLEGVRSRPRYSPMLSVEARSPTTSFQRRGPEVLIDYQIVPIQGSSTPSVQKKVAIGDLNTVDELTRYLGELTGFTQFIGISRGQRMAMAGNETTIRDSKVGMGNLIVQKIPDSPERQPATSPHSGRSMDSHIMSHFEELYDLLEFEGVVASNVYGFLDLFPPQPMITDLVRVQHPSVSQILPFSKPFKLLYGLNAMRLCVEDEALGSAPNESLLTYTVNAMLLLLKRPTEKENSTMLRRSIDNLLTECLLLALRAQVSPATTQKYFSSCDDLAPRLIEMTLEASESSGTENSSVQLQTLIRQPFAVLVECALQSAQVRAELSSNSRFQDLFKRVLLHDHRIESRQAVADVILDLAGQPPNKTNVHKIPDPRSVRSRFDADRIEQVLKTIWASTKSIVADSCATPATSRQLFEVLLAMLRVIVNGISTEELSACFREWSELLVNYNHQEVVGKSKDDYVLWGLSSLLRESFPLLQSSQEDIATASIARSLFDKFLFPSSRQDNNSSGSGRIPLLREGLREDLYDLIMLIIREKADYDTIVERLGGLMEESVPDFPPHFQCERQALRAEVGYAGMRNLSNTCYLNSLFAQLFMNLEFRDYVFTKDPVQSNRSDQVLLRELSRLFASIQNRWDKYVDTSDAVACIETYDNEQIDVSVQMDVDEFFNLLFDRLEAQIDNAEDRSIFKSLYGGQLVQQIKSRECEHISERLEPFSAIQCEIKGKTNLEDSLRAYVEGEVMQGDNKYSCTSCDRHVDAVKRACFKDIPNHLIFNLKRFDFDITTMTRCKVNDEFHFPQTINMAPYTVDFLSDAGNAADPDTFELVGILVHSGTAESGHYYSYIRERPSSRLAPHSWLQFNDIDVSRFDPHRIADCCFGGIELQSAVQLTKSYNAYMLFYQRTQTIQRFETKYDNHDDENPIRLEFDASLAAIIDLRNQETVRSYCLQDPGHARFMRLMLEKMRWDHASGCSDTHAVENQMVGHSLDYIHQISCRFKDMPEFEATCKLLQDYCHDCYSCASRIASFFADKDATLGDAGREGVLRCAILRNSNAAVRRSFGALLCQALRKMRQGSPEGDLRVEDARIEEIQYHETFSLCISHLAQPWSEIQKFSRAWNDYFDLLSRLTGMGVWEAGAVLRSGFLQKVGELIWADVHHDPMDLRMRYVAYVSAREKGRVFSFSGLIALLATILEYVRFSTKHGIDNSRIPDEDGRYELTLNEAQLLSPTKGSAKPKLSLVWFHKIVMTKHNPNAAKKMVASLLRESVLAASLQITLSEGLSSDTVLDAVAFLDPAIAFCKHCSSANLIQQLIKDALDCVDSLGGVCGQEHLDFLVELVELENQPAGLTQQEFFTMVFRHLKSWAPALLLFPDDIHHDVRNQTMTFLENQLLRPLKDHDLAPEQPAILTRYTRNLAKACIVHLQQQYIPAPGNAQVTRIELGQTNQMRRIVQHICEHFFDNGDAADDHFVTEAMSTLDHVQAFTQEAAEVTSADWPDNDSIPVSDSDPGDYTDWNEGI